MMANPWGWFGNILADGKLCPSFDFWNCQALHPCQTTCIPQPIIRLNSQTQQQSSKQETSSTVSKKSCQVSLATKLDLKMLEEMKQLAFLMDRWTWGQAGQLVWWWTWQTDTFSQHAHHGCQQTPVFKRVPNIHDAQTVWLLLAQSHNHWHLSDRAMSWYMEFFDFWFCLLRGTWLFLLMGSRCQTKQPLLILFA